jgi:long-chain acyl-CoA synthetase
MLRPSKEGFQPISYKELWDHAREYAAALKSLGLQQGDRLCIQCENCCEWAFIDWAAQCLGIIVVPIYPTLPADQSQHIIRDCGSKAIISGSAEQEAKARGVEGLQVVPLDEVKGLTKTAEPMTHEAMDAHIDAVKSDDVATIIYTSGTTGVPKGAMLQHSAFTFLMTSIVQSLPIRDTDTFLSFLPLSHVYERVAGHVLPISCGATIAYSQNLRTLASDLVEAKPTIMLCVPRFLEATMDRITEGVSKQPPLKQKLFKWALSQGAKKAKGEFAPFAGLLDKLVGEKIRERTGGRIRFFVSGGAALPPHVSYFYMAFNLKVLQGYGLTETTAASCVNHPDDIKPWTVGPPIPGVEIKIASDGEILIKGPSRMLGYYNMPEETKAAIDEDGWFHTGDIGEMEGKYLKITDRKKDLLVLANGKNIAPQHIENKLRESPLISEAVLFGDGMEYVCALIIPNFEAVKKQMAEAGVQAPENEQLIGLDKVKELIKAEVDKVNKALADYEKVKKHVLLDAQFSIDGGELTPSMKVKRKVVKEKYATQIQSMMR